MADSNPDRITGPGCAAALDTAAQTLTFEHRGWFRSKAQKASPIVVPLSEIAAIEYKSHGISTWVRIVRRGQKRWTDVVENDPHAVTTYNDPRAFAERVRLAARLDDSLVGENRVELESEVDAEPDPGASATKTSNSGEKSGAAGVGELASRIIDVLGNLPSG
jgi:hypothetical protein